MLDVTTFSIIATMAVTTYMIRGLPFLIWKDAQSTPDFIRFLGQKLPQAMIALLVIYCLRNVSFRTGTHGLAEIIACVVIALLQLKKHNSILSIVVGTGLYMFLVQVVF